MHRKMGQGGLQGPYEAADRGDCGPPNEGQECTEKADDLDLSGKVPVPGLGAQDDTRQASQVRPGLQVKAQQLHPSRNTLG